MIMRGGRQIARSRRSYTQNCERKISNQGCLYVGTMVQTRSRLLRPRGPWVSQKKDVGTSNVDADRAKHVDSSVPGVGDR